MDPVALVALAGLIGVCAPQFWVQVIEAWERRQEDKALRKFRASAAAKRPH